MSVSAFQPDPQERRGAERSKVSIGASIRDQNGNRLRVMIDELSATGFRCEYILTIEAGTLIWVTLPDMAPMSARAIRFNAFIYAFAFEVPLHDAVVDHLLRRFAV